MQTSAKSSNGSGSYKYVYFDLAFHYCEVDRLSTRSSQELSG